MIPPPTDSVYGDALEKCLIIFSRIFCWMWAMTRMISAFNYCTVRGLFMLTRDLPNIIHKV